MANSNYTSPLHFKPLQESLKRLLDSSKYSDLTIQCDDQQWLVHKSIVCSQSDFFSAACDRDFKVRRRTMTLGEYSSLMDSDRQTIRSEDVAYVCLSN
jgi:hypothetical protein